MNRFRTCTSNKRGGLGWLCVRVCVCLCVASIPHAGTSITSVAQWRRRSSITIKYAQTCLSIQSYLLCLRGLIQIWISADVAPDRLTFDSYLHEITLGLQFGTFSHKTHERDRLSESSRSDDTLPPARPSPLTTFTFSEKLLLEIRVSPKLWSWSTRPVSDSDYDSAT